MLVASVIVSLIGVLIAGVGGWKAFHVKPRDYTIMVTLEGREVSHDPTSVNVRDLVLDQRSAASWVLVGTVVQFVSVLLALVQMARS